MSKKPTKNIRMYDGTDSEFLAACTRADTRPYKRQYQKWCQKRGLAWRNRNKE